jgi:PadR family transcriptional regulator, regulatory protein PadR
MPLLVAELNIFSNLFVFERNNILPLYNSSCIIHKDNIMNKNNQLSELLSAWEETYKKGQLTLWIFLSLKEGKKYVDEIKNFVEKQSANTMTCENQSLYRNLRKFQHVGVVDFETGAGNKGPERKYYFLTELGQKLLDSFIERNISLFFNHQIKSLINQED